MNKLPIVLEFESNQLKSEVDTFCIGDLVDVHTLIREGDKTRKQLFGGTVIAKSGAGISETFTVRRISYGEGMERVFMLHSPAIAKIEVHRSSVVRRAKLTFLRQRSGKSAKLRQKIAPRRAASGS